MDLPSVEKARSWLATFLKHIFTGPDNETYAIDRVLWPLLMIYAMACKPSRWWSTTSRSTSRSSPPA
jgi:hypothetical protein